MDEISVKGEKYLKAAIVAEKLGYTSDYVGQLCRSGQVKATLVGRSWYVNEKSISEHKKGRYRSTLTKSKESVRKMAEERITTVKASPRFMKRVAQYQPDEGDLMPVILNKPTIVIKDKKDKEVEIETEQVGEIAIKKYAVEEEQEYKPQNNSSVRLSEKSNIVIRRPSVRVISYAKPVAVSGDKATVVTDATVSSTSRRINNSRRKPAGTLGVIFFITTFILVVGVALSINGLEKRVVTISKDEEVILYNFNIAHIKKTAKDFVNVIHNNFIF